MIKKLLQWVGAVVSPLLGIVETVLKFIKELLTLVVAILFPIIPNDKFKSLITWLRDIVNKIYEWVSANKEKILAATKLI